MNVDVVTQIDIARPINIVAAYATDPSNAPEWYDNIDSVEWKTPPPAQIGSQVEFVARFLGRTLRYTYEFAELVPGERVVMRTQQGPFPMETTYTWEAATNGETRMTLRNRGEPAGFSSVMAPLMKSAMRRANRKDLELLKLLLEPAQKEDAPMKLPPIVSAEEWEAAHQELLVEEKALTRARDAMAAKRRRMPWMAVEKEYRFEGPTGPASLADLFAGRRQLIVYRAFYAPDVTTYPQGGGSYPARACVGCSMLADQVSHPAHLNARDTTLVFVSRAPQAEIRGLQERMGWELIPWYTLTDDFDADFGVDQWHGTNAFVREGDRIFRTYYVHDRGDEQLGSVWSYLDITALGRQEEWEDSPEGYPQTPPYEWWNYHDAYRNGA